MSVETYANSRPLGVAEHFTGKRVDSRRVYSKRVILCGDHSTLSTENGYNCMVDALLLLARVVGNLTVAVPDDLPALHSDVAQLVDTAWRVDKLRMVESVSEQMLSEADAILFIGSEVRPNLPWTSINSNGWVGRVSSGSKPLSTDCSSANPLGALLAASFGATEIFKRIFEVSESLAPLFDHYEFSLFDLSADTNEAGPQLPDTLSIGDILLVGAGAIGNGIALLFSQLMIGGRTHIIDKQVFADENQATCVLLEKDGWLGKPKAERLAEWLIQNSSVGATGKQALIADTINSNDLRDFDLRVVLTALDDPDARCEAQRLWPPLIVDGGLNEVGAAVTQHRLGHLDLACLQCWFHAPEVDARIVQSRLTGLPADRLDDIYRQINDDDIQAANQEKQEALRVAQREGKRLCSVITELQLAKFEVDVEEGFRPSVPFIATAAATLVVSEMIKALYFPNARFGSQFQFANLFLGPDASNVWARDPSENCTCVKHQEILMNYQMQELAAAI